MRAAREELRAFLEGAFPGASIVPMTGDASTRCFYRLVAAGGPGRVVMDYGERFTGETDDVRATGLFEAAGLPVAGILRVAGDPGCLILEDLGERTLEQALSSASPQERARLYRAATDLAAGIANRGTPELARRDGAWPALDADRFRFEMDFFVEHYARGLMDRVRVSPELVELLHALADRTAETPRQVLCHRDFHSRNLMLRDDGTLAMVDIQDARWGPDTYDVASLLRDAYVDLGEDESERMLADYRDALADPPEPLAFRARFGLVTAQRMIKALGTFGYQVCRLERVRYLEPIPRTVERLRRELPGRPETAPLGRALERDGLLELPRR